MSKLTQFTQTCLVQVWFYFKFKIKISLEPDLLDYFDMAWNSLFIYQAENSKLKKNITMIQWSNSIFSVVMNAFELFWKTLACTICWRTLIDDRTTKQKRLCSKAVQWPKVHTQATYYIPGYIHYTLFCFSKLTWFVIMLIHLVHLTATTKLIFRIPLLESQYILRNLNFYYSMHQLNA